MTQNGRRQPQGDEHEIFLRYSDELIRVTARRIKTTPENVEDACAFAWATFMARQPRRETVFGWLSEVARNEALRLDSDCRRRDDSFEKAIELTSGHRDPIAAKEILIETEAMLSPLRERERAALLLHGLGWSYADAAIRLGVTARRLNQIVTRARERLREAERERQLSREDLPPRARLLAELQRDPPPFLLAAIGRPPPASPKKGGQQVRLEWARLALAIVDHRVRNGITDPARALCAADRSLEDPQRDQLQSSLDRYNDMRRPGRSQGRSIDR